MRGEGGTADRRAGAGFCGSVERETKSARLGAGDSSDSTLEEVKRKCEGNVKNM